METQLLREFLVLVQKYQNALNAWYIDQANTRKLRTEKILYKKLKRANRDIMYIHNISGSGRILAAITQATNCRPAVINN